MRVYTSRLLGRNSELVLHGGGNTSVKTTIKDIDGKNYDVLCVKGSGWDMAEIEPEGLPAVKLKPLLSLKDELFIIFKLDVILKFYNFQNFRCVMRIRT